MCCPPLVRVVVDAPGVIGAAVGEEQAAPRAGVDPAAAAGPRPAVAPGNAGVQRGAGRSQLQLGAAGGLGTSWGGGGGQLQQLVNARQAALRSVSRRQLHAQDENWNSSCKKSEDLHGVGKTAELSRSL